MSLMLSLFCILMFKHHVQRKHV